MIRRSEIVEFKEAIMTNIDKSVPYVAANLAIEPSSDGASLTWDHGKCIKSYTIRACEILDSEEMCYEEAVVVERPERHKMTHTVRNLKACSKHQLEIFPLTDEDTELTAAPRSFMTVSPPASPPQQVKVRLNMETNKVDMSWSRVQCALGYRIHQNLGNSDTETKWDSEGLSVSLESPEPCVTYSYGVSAIVGGQESETTEMQEVPVPPRVGLSEHPILVIQEKVNGSVTFVINNADKNLRCKVGQYHVKCGTMDQVFEASSLEDGKMTMEVPVEDCRIQGRIHYTDFHTWSPWISSDSPRQEAFGAQIDFLLPIVAGVMVTAAVLVILTVLIVRRKKSQLKYDAEKAEGDSDESKKLNEKTEGNIISS
jgi:hypothetical protein